MRTIIENLLALQKLALQPKPWNPANEARMLELRQTVPPPVLEHFDRMVNHGRSAVALVRHGMCSECHIRVPVSTLASLVAPQDVYLCEICSCYLLLPLEEVANVGAHVKLKPVSKRVVVKSPPAPTEVVVP